LRRQLRNRFVRLGKDLDSLHRGNLFQSLLQKSLLRPLWQAVESDCPLTLVSRGARSGHRRGIRLFRLVIRVAEHDFERLAESLRSAQRTGRLCRGLGSAALTCYTHLRGHLDKGKTAAFPLDRIPAELDVLNSTVLCQ